MNEGTRRRLRIVAWISFVGYLILLAYFLFFAEVMGRTFSERSYHYNLVPLKEIRRFITYRETLGNMAVFLNLAGNVIAFIPFGLFLPLLARKYRNFWHVVVLSFDFSLLVEIIQLISKVGSFDVDDILLNTIGGAIGFIGFRLVKYIQNRFFRRT